MPQRIDVPGVGVVEFPDGMSDDQIAAAIRSNGQPQQDRSIRPTDFWPVRAAQGIAHSIGSAVTLPGDASYGRTGAVTEDDLTRQMGLEPPGRDTRMTTGRVMDLAALGMPINPAIRAGDRAIPGAGMAMREARPVVPTATELRESGSAGFNAARNPGVDVTVSSVQNLGSRMRAELERDGIFETDAPKTFAHIARLENPPEGATVATFSNLDAARRAFGRAAGSPDKTERLAASRAIDGLDQFARSVPEESVLAGSPASAAQASETARGNYAAGMRSNRITGELDNAYTGVAERGELNAAVANSGQNIGNAIRQRIASALKDPKQLRGYSPEEIAQMERVAFGTVPGNLARYGSNLLAGGGGVGAALLGAAGSVAGTAAAGPYGALAGLAPVVGIGLRQVSNASTRRQANQLDEMIRTRSPLYEERAANPSMEPISATRRAALVRALSESANGNGGGGGW